MAMDCTLQIDAAITVELGSPQHIKPFPLVKAMYESLKSSSFFILED